MSTERGIVILGWEFRWNRTPRWGVRNRNFRFRFRNSENFRRKTIGKKIMGSCQKIGIGISDFGIPAYYVRRTYYVNSTPRNHSPQGPA